MLVSDVSLKGDLQNRYVRCSGHKKSNLIWVGLQASLSRKPFEIHLGGDQRRAGRHHPFNAALSSFSNLLSDLDVGVTLATVCVTKAVSVLFSKHPESVVLCDLFDSTCKELSFLFVQFFKLTGFWVKCLLIQRQYNLWNSIQIQAVFIMTFEMFERLQFLTWKIQPLILLIAPSSPPISSQNIADAVKSSAPVRDWP